MAPRRLRWGTLRRERGRPAGELCAAGRVARRRRCAEQDDSALERRAALDRAVALSPGLELARARRFSAARLERGDAAGALADAEHLEAMTPGARGKHDQNLRAARAFAAAGFVVSARRCFERALRYAPDDALATAGLALRVARSGPARPRDRVASPRGFVV